MDTGKVPGEIGTIPELWDVIGTPRGEDMDHMGHKRGAHQPTRGGAPPLRHVAELEKE